MKLLCAASSATLAVALLATTPAAAADRDPGRDHDSRILEPADPHDGYSWDHDSHHEQPVPEPGHSRDHDSRILEPADPHDGYSWDHDSHH